MNQDPVTLGPVTPATRAPVFFWITVGLLAMLALGGVVAALLLVVFAAENINRSGGWGWLLVLGLYVVAITAVCFACALLSAVSLWRHESHRRLSIAILIISGLVVLAFGPNLVRYSLFPRKMLQVRQEAVNGRVGRNFLIGERNGKWYIVTMAGRLT